MKKLYSIVFGILLMSSASFAQLADQPYSVEAVKHHDGIVGNTDLTGYTTYRVYLHLQHQTDFVSAIYGNDRGDNTLPFTLDFTCDLYQSPEGSFLGNNVSSNLAEYIPEVAYDSWFTIGAEDSQSPGDATSVFAEPATMDVVQAFNQGGSMNVADGAIFTLNDAQHPNGEAKLDQYGQKKVLIGQFTTCGDFEWCLNVQIFPSRDGQEEIRESVCISSTCPSNVANANWDAVPVTEVDAEDGKISISSVEEVNQMNLYRVNLPGADLVASSKGQEATFENLAEGLYYVELDRGQYCRQSTEIIDLRSSETDESATVGEQVNNNLNVSVYPNPGTGIYQMEVAEEANVRYSVQDLQGRTIIAGKVNNFLAGTTKTLDISNSANGTYIVKVYVNDEVKNIRLIKAD